MAIQRILLVDDEDPVRKALRRTLASEPYEVVDCNCARDALALLRQTEVDVIVSDFLMPEMNGLEFLKHARVLRPEAIRIMLTGHADVEMAVAAINEGAVYRFLLKPWDSFDVRVMIKLAMRHVAAMRENERHAAIGREAEAARQKITGERSAPTPLPTASGV